MELIIAFLIGAVVCLTWVCIKWMHRADQYQFLWRHGWQVERHTFYDGAPYYKYFHPDDTYAGTGFDDVPPLQRYRTLKDAVKRQKLINEHERLNVPMI